MLSGMSLEVPRSPQELGTGFIFAQLGFVSCREHVQPSHLPRPVLLSRVGMRGMASWRSPDGRQWEQLPRILCLQSSGSSLCLSLTEISNRV